MSTKHIVAFAAVLAAIWAMYPALATAGAVGSIEGTWVATSKTPAGDILFLQTFAPLSVDPMSLVGTMQQVNDDPTYFGTFPKADGGSLWAGNVTHTGPTSVESTFIRYLTRSSGGGGGSLAETVAILVLHGRWALAGADAWNGEISISAYRADQDADGNGLPDEGETPVDCSTFPCSGTRLGRLPACAEEPQEVIETEVGHTFTIFLASNPTTGYSWQIAGKLPDGLELIGTDFQSSQADPGTVGGGGLEQWTFKATKAGNMTLVLEYRRPWEKEGPPAQRHVFLIKARSSSKPVEADRVIETQPGAAFKIGMESNPSTGYAWKLASTLPSWLTLLEHKYKAGACPPGYTGCEGVEEWTFDVKGAGQALLTFEYRRSWEEDEPASRQLTCLVISE